MKHYLICLLAMSLAASTPLGAQAASPQDEVFKAIQSDIRKKDYADAITKAQQALADKTLSPADKARFLNYAADASMKQKPPQYEQAKAFYLQITEDEAMSNTSRINALNDLADLYIATLAGQYLDRMDIAPANAYLDRALKLPNLTPAEQALAFTNIGKLCTRETRYDDAIAAYKSITTLDVNAATKNKAWQAIGDLQASQGKADDAIATYKEHGFDLVTIYKELGREDLAVAEITKVLDDDSATDKDKWAAFRKLPFWRNRNDIEGNASSRKFSEKYLPALMQSDAQRAVILLPRVKATPVFRNSFYTRNLANPDFLSWAAPIVLQAPKLSDKDYALVKMKHINALASLGQTQKIVTESAGIQDDARLDKATQFWAKLVNFTFSSKVKNAIAAINEEKQLPEKEKAQAVLDAAQTTLQADKDEAAQALYAAYVGLFIHLPQATIECSFTDNAPFDVGSWQVSSLVKNKKKPAQLDRPYGDNLQLLLATDSSSTGRNVDADNAKTTGDTDTNFYAACDAQGIHLFFDLRDSHVNEVRDGLTRGGSIEMYLAPGKDQAYLTYIPRWPSAEMFTSFLTMYPNAGFRVPSVKDGSLRYSILPTENGFAMSMFLSWENFYDKLPANGTKWQFEAIRWTRSGGFSFGGSQSVHNRSSWGDIVFDGLSEKNLLAIKRHLIFKALDKYKAAIGLVGVAGKWNDPDLGDPVFYAKDIAPLVARWKEYADKVNGQMSDDDVEMLFQQAVPDWMGADYRIAALRRQYLIEKELS